MRKRLVLGLAASLTMILGGVGCGNDGALPKLEGAVAISAGGQHACAMLGDGTAACWGGNGSQELGSQARSITEPRPVFVGGLSSAKSVAAGGLETCALLEDGTISCWGDNTWGQLGRGNAETPSSSTPSPVAGLSGVLAVAVSGPGEDNPFASGQDHFACALLTSGAVDCWGLSTSDEVGTADVGQLIFPSPMPVAGVTSAVAVGLGASGVCAVLSDGTVACWGSGFGGVLGQAEPPGGNSPTPVMIEGLPGPALAVTGGTYHRCALLRDGTVWCWGSDVGGQGLIGAGTATAGIIVRTPVAVSNLSGVTQVSAGPFHTCAVRADGTVWCWGQNDGGQVGGTPPDPALVPTQIVGVTGATAISSGQSFACALLGTGEVQCWGDDAAGELGDGATAAAPPAAPAFVVAPAGSS
jgi:alpha-tubulin suppressor-like RCC1 family protein